MNPALATLFLPFENGLLRRDPQQKILFLNAQTHPILKSWPRENLTLVQDFKPYADALEGVQFAPDGPCDLVFVLLPKNQKEAEYFLTQAQGALKSGGVLLCAAENKAGGNRAKKMMETLGFEGVYDFSKNKSRVAWAVKKDVSDTASRWREQGEIQSVMGGTFVSRPGLFSWDRLDKGSAILLQHLPVDLKGTGADFGCGYGALSRAVLDRAGVEKLYCLDADRRAVECCARNVVSPRAEFAWADLTKPQAALKNLDFIVMNPPFHEGKSESVALGKAFIETAHNALKNSGRLFVVANAHLPYEDLLRARFKHGKKLHEGQGFKLYEAEK